MCACDATVHPQSAMADGDGDRSLSLAIIDRDIESIRAVIEPVLDDATLRISLPKVLTSTEFSEAKELVTNAKELVSACRAHAGSPRTKGAFCVIIVTPSAPRAASLCGVLNRGGISVAKLFGRHLDLDEQKAFLAANMVDVAVGTPNRLAKLAESGALELNALRYILLDVLPDEKESHFFSRPPKGMARRPDTTELLGMLHTPAFSKAFAQNEKRAPVLCPVLLPPKEALESSTPVGQKMNNRARGRGRGGAGRGGKGRGGPPGKGGGRGGKGGGIHKKGRPGPMSAK